MKIINVKSQGYCFGVKNALKILKKVFYNKNIIKPIFIFGLLVHNMHVINSLKKLGIKIILENEQINIIKTFKKGTIIIASHGIKKNIKKMILKKKIHFYDATCIKISNIYKIIEKYINYNYEIIFVGKKFHPETESILSISKKIHLISNEYNAKCFLNIINNKKKKFFLTTQTTFNKLLSKKIISIFKKRNNNIIIKNNFCSIIEDRQKELIKYSKVCDVIFIIGDFKSNNSKYLFEIAKKLKKKTYFIFDILNLKLYMLKDVKKILIISGTSTPNYIIKKIINYFKQNKLINKNNINPISILFN